MRNLNKYLTPIVLFGVFFFIRLSLISKGPYHADALGIALYAENILNTGQMSYLPVTGHPITLLLGSLFIGIFKLFSIQDPVIGANMMSVVFNSLSIYVFYFCVKELFNKQVALLSTLLLAGNRAFFAISTFASSHNPSLFFCFLGIYFLIRYQKSLNWSYLIWSGIWLGFMGAARLQDLLVIVVPIIAIFFLYNQQPKKPQAKKTFTIPIVSLTILSFITTITVFIFYLPLFFKQGFGPMLSSMSALMKSEVIDSFQVAGLTSKKLIFIIKYLFTTQSLIGGITAALGLIFMAAKRSKIFIFVVIWLACPVFILGSLSYFTPRFFIIPSLTLIIAQGFFLSEITKIRPWFHFVAIALAFICFFINFTQVYPLLKFRHDNALIVDYFKWVKEQTEPNAHIMERDSRVFIRHYSQRKAILPPVLSKSRKYEKLEQFKANIDSLLDQKIPVYITSFGLTGYPPKMKFDQYVLKHYHLELVGYHLIEEWHSGTLLRDIYANGLFRMQKKNDQ